MANLNRRITPAVRGAVKKLRHGEIPFPLEPKTMPWEEKAQFWREMQPRRQFIHARLKDLSNDSSIRGHRSTLRNYRPRVALGGASPSRPQAPPSL